jgi:hypothetical protein
MRERESDGHWSVEAFCSPFLQVSARQSSPFLFYFISVDGRNEFEYH